MTDVSTTLNLPVSSVTLAKLDEAATEKMYMNDVLWRRMKTSSSVYKNLFGNEASDLKLLADAVFLEDGVSKDGSVARWKNMTRKFAKMWILLSHIEGEKKITDLLSDEFGLSLVNSDETKNFLAFNPGGWDQEDVKSILAEGDIQIHKGMLSETILKTLVTGMNKTQAELIGTSEHLYQITLEEVVTLEPIMKKSNAKRIVNIKVAELRRLRRKRKNVSKKEEEINSTGRFLEVLDVAVADPDSAAE